MWWAWVQDDSSSKEVSWQSAFWALAPLALSTMTQPSGQVLQYPPQLRTYLRSSPIVCGFDAFAQLLRFSIYVLTGYCTGPTHAAIRVMQIRSRPSRRQGREEGFQALENLPTVRYIIFFFGTLPQVIKLMALGGLRWTKAWGGLYIANFVIMECFVLAGERSSYQVLEADDEDENAISGQPRWMRTGLEHLEANLEIFEMVCGFAAIAMQVCFLGWVFYVLLRPFIDFSGILGDPDSKIYAVSLVVWIPATYLACLAYLVLTWACFVLPTYRTNRFFYFCAGVSGLLSLTAWPVGVFFLFTFVEKEKVLEFLTGTNIIVLAYIATLGLLWILGEVLALDKWIRYKLLLVKREENVTEEAKHWSIAAWSIFVGTVVLAVLYYAFRYDPRGTFKPRWTNSFG
ncbi:hypothetical protein CC78DRAFT_585514 [Lojkania enalia]|uniref:Transmembrane protein n=1 Tax=Lojkania enalia TaxID=147567 RepID=A0A9P4K5F7_9PLEO|nr:hypothetical protein CC78DRAFT_585514 [Didymosphaeria enalia]